MLRIVSLLCVLAAAAAQNDLFELNIIHFNDFHAHFEEISPTGTICNAAEAACIGGYARLFTAIKEAKEAEPESLVLNGGDTFQGTIWYNFLRWNVSQHFMNLLPHDAHVLGNHEFDHGPEGLLPYLERLNAPMLGANVNTTFEPDLTPYIRNHIVLERGGRRIGIIGVLLRVFSAPIGNVIMEDEMEAINREAAILSAQAVDIIIVLSHCGYDSDVRMAGQISSDVDIIVGAHSHTLLYNGETPNGDWAAGEYPTPVVRTDGHRILVVQASCYTRYLGNIKLFFDNASTIQGWEGVPIFLGSSIVQDPQMMEELEPWRQEVDAVGKEVLGRMLTPLSRSCYSRECNIGSWACDGFLQQVLGNHEFDHGPEGLLPYLERLNAPMLGANVNTTFEPDLTPYIRNHIVLERGGRRIGIIGVLLRVFSAPIGNVIMEDEMEAINREAAILSAQAVDIIIVLSHCGYDSDVRMAGQISSDVDIIVGAHSHTLLYNGETPNGDWAAGEYPTPVVRTDGHRILVVQASCYTRYLGNIKLFFDNASTIQGWEGVPIFLGSSIVQDPQMMEELEPWRQEVDAVGKEVLGRMLTPLSRSCYSRECNIGSWACDGFLQQVMDKAAGGAWHGAHACLINAGGLRAAVDRGEVTTESLLMAIPFENYVQMYDLKGEHLLEALEFSVGVAMAPGDFYSGRMLQIGGMRVVYNASAPAGSRVQACAVRCTECAVPRYLPLDRAATYRLLTQNYIGDGGGGYTMLSENRENLENLQLDYVMLQQYLRHQGAAMQDLDGRIQIVF